MESPHFAVFSPSIVLKALKLKLSSVKISCYSLQEDLWRDQIFTLKITFTHILRTCWMLPAPCLAAVQLADLNSLTLSELTGSPQHPYCQDHNLFAKTIYFLESCTWLSPSATLLKLFLVVTNFIFIKKKKLKERENQNENGKPSQSCAWFC